MLTKTNTSSQEQIIKELERSIQKLYDESIILKFKGDLQNAKDKCSLAYEKFFDFKSKNQDYFNIELEFGMKLNLGLIHQALNQLEEAKHVYQDILKNETYYSPGIQHNRIRVNLGNIFFTIAGQKTDPKEKLQNYKNAITEYRKAVDKINKENKELKSNIMKNIALCHIKLGNYPDAIEVYTDALKLNPDIRTALNLLLCHLAVGEIEQTKNVFNIMLEVSSIGDAELQDVNENKQEMDALKEYLLVRKKDVIFIFIINRTLN